MAPVQISPPISTVDEIGVQPGTWVTLLTDDMGDTILPMFSSYEPRSDCERPVALIQADADSDQRADGNDAGDEHEKIHALGNPSDAIAAI